MADEGAEVAVEAEEQPAKKDKSGSMVMILVVMSVLVMVLTPVITLVAINHLIPNTPEIATKERVTEIELPQIQVNVANTNGTRYAQIEIVVAVSNESMVPLFQEQDDQNPNGKRKRMVATINEIISSKNLNELLEKEAKESLKKEILNALNNIIAEDTEGVVKEVYFPGFLIQ